MIERGMKYFKATPADIARESQVQQTVNMMLQNAVKVVSPKLITASSSEHSDSDNGKSVRKSIQGNSRLKQIIEEHREQSGVQDGKTSTSRQKRKNFQRNRTRTERVLDHVALSNGKSTHPNFSDL